MLSQVFNRVFNKTPWFCLLALFLVSWLLYGRGAIDAYSDPDKKLETFVNRQIEKLRTVDPEAGAQLAQLSRRSDARALAASLRVYDAENGGDGSRQLAGDLAQSKGNGVRWYSLSAIGISDPSLRDSRERDEFIRKHGVAYQGLAAMDASGGMAEEYARRLGEAEQTGGAAWAAIKDEPAALSILPLLEAESAARDYYLREREWLTPVLISIPADADEAAAPPVRELTLVAERYHPLFKDLYLEKMHADQDLNPEFGAMLLDLFRRHGDFFEVCRRFSLPLGELVEIVYANPSVFDFSEEPEPRAREIERAAEDLALIHQSKPRVWSGAGSELNVLWLERYAPEQTEKLLDLYPDADLPTFIYTFYPDLAANAAQAIVKFGDLGIYMLQTYKDHAGFRRHLKDPKIGVRIVPFVAMFPDDAFAKLDGGDHQWVDKYFLADGTEKDQGWVKDIPLIGGPANVVGNWVNGTPNTWGELGWAAFDVADTALLVLTLGSAKVAAEGAKQGLKTASRAAGRSAAETAVRKASQKALVGVAAQKATRGALVSGAGRAASLLARVARLGVRTVSITGGYAVSAGKAVWTTARAAWRTLPPTLRRGIYGMAAFSMLMYSSQQRNTPDAFRRMMGDLGIIVGKTIQAVGVGSAEMVVNAVNEVLRGATGELSDAGRQAVWFGGIVAFAALVFFLRPSRKDASRFVKGF